jgi:flagellar motility protein MotE (MotC chaperone)
MIRFARDFRLIPIVLIATISLFALKVSGLVFDGGYTLADRLQDRSKPTLKINPGESVPEYPKIVIAGDPNNPSAPAVKQSWAKEMFNFGGAIDHDVTGSVDKQKESSKEKDSAKEKAKPSKEKAAEKPADGDFKVSNTRPPPPKVEAGDTVIPIVPGHINSPGERAILESLQKRREQLDARARDLDMRENLLKATEKRVEAKVTELKDVESKVKAAEGNRTKTEAKNFKDIITMYENMKPKDAARIFNRLDMNILVEVSTKMNPRSMSAIMAQMAPESAERLTVELATLAGAQQPKPEGQKQLPKIEGKPNGG